VSARRGGDLGPWLAAAAVLGGTALPARGAPTGPEPVRFAWVRAEGADGCADQQDIEAQVTARLGRSPFSADAPRSIEVVVRRVKHGFRAVIYVRGAGDARAGSRELSSEAAECTSIEAASVLALALTIDPDAAIRAPLPAAPPAAAAPVLLHLGSAPPAGLPVAVVPMLSLLAPPLPAELPPEPEPAPRAQKEAPGASGLALRAGAGVGLLPKVAPGVALAGQGVVTRAVWITGEALWMPEARTGDGRFGFGLTAFALGACFVPVRLAAVELGACGSAWAGALHAVVYQLAPVTPGDSAWAAAAASPYLRLRLAEHLHAEVGGHLLVPLTRHPFVLGGPTDLVFREAPVTFFPFAGLGARFP
jgi:hypothetical protein